MSEPVLGRACPHVGFKHRTAKVLRERADIARRAMDPSVSIRRPGHFAALEELADHIEQAALTDQNLVALYELQSATEAGTDTFTPGELQTAMLVQIGLHKDAPEPAEALAELVALGIKDSQAALRDARMTLQPAQAKAEAAEVVQAQLLLAGRVRLTRDRKSNRVDPGT